MKYVAFISYRHTKFSQTHAECLEKALKRYARPLLKPPIAIFRDERILKPGDDLPKELRHALESSEYLIYLASRDAAESPWVTDELQIWCDELNRSEKLIIVHISDQLSIDHASKSIAWEKTDALSLKLRQHINFLPVYSDLTWAKREAQLDLNNLEYKKEINAIVARLREKLPGEMNDEEVLTHRRNIRLRRLAVITVIVFAFATGIAAWIANSARQSEQAQRIRAEESLRKLRGSQAELLSDLPGKGTDALLAAIDAMSETLEIEGSENPEAMRGLFSAVRAFRSSIPLRPDKEAFGSVTFFKNGDLFATTGERKAQVWDIRTGELVITLNDVTSPLRSIVRSGNGDRILTINENGDTVLWDATTSSVISKLPKARIARSFASFSPNGGEFITWNGTETIEFWDARIGNRLMSNNCESAVSDVSYTVDGQNVITFTASKPAEAKLWSRTTWREVARLDVRKHRNVSIVSSKDGSYRFTRVDNRNPFWYLTRGFEVDITNSEEEVNEILGSDIKIVPAQVARNGFMGDLYDGTLEVRHGTSNKLIETLVGHERRVGDFSFSVDRRLLATASEDRTVRIWSTQHWQTISVLRGHNNSVSLVKFSPDDRNLITLSSDGTARIWTLDPGQAIATFQPPTTNAVVASFSPNLKTLVVKRRPEWGEPATLPITLAWLFDLKSGIPMTSLPGEVVVYSPKGDFLAASSQSYTMLFDAKTGENLKEFSGTGRVTSMGFHPAGDRIVLVSKNGVVRVWNVDNWELVWEDCLPGGANSSVAFSADGSLLVVGIGEHLKPGTAVGWNVATGKRIFHKRDLQELLSAEVSPDGSQILTVEAIVPRVWHFNTGQELTRLKGHSNWVWTGKYSPDGTRIVTSSEDNTAQVWNSQTGERTAILEGHSNVILAAEFSPDGARVVTASFDGTARLWDARTGENLGVLIGHTSEVASAEFAQDGSYILTADWSGTAKLYPAKMEGLMSLACQLFRHQPEAGLVRNQCCLYAD